MAFLSRLIKGMVIGIAALTAGAGTFAIVLGVYDRCMAIIAKPFVNFKENLKFIFPIIIGILLSVGLSFQGIKHLFENYATYVNFVFLGIIIGGMPLLVRVANKKGFKKKYLVALVLAFLFTLIINKVINMAKVNLTEDLSIDTFELVIYGIVYGFGAIMPGMTTIHLLVAMGVVTPIMGQIFSFDMGTIIPFGLRIYCNSSTNSKCYNSAI